MITLGTTSALKTELMSRQALEIREALGTNSKKPGELGTISGARWTMPTSSRRSEKKAFRDSPATSQHQASRVHSSAGGAWEAGLAKPYRMIQF